jgi:hypothetical protein
MGKASRRKGATYEREVANLFKEMGWEDAKRHLEYQSDEAVEGRDLDGTQPFAVQAKCWAKTPSISAITEIEVSDAYSIPLAILKRSKVGEQPLEVAVMYLDDFKVFLSMLIEALREGESKSG